MNARIISVVAVIYLVLMGATLYAWQNGDLSSPQPHLATPGRSNYYVTHPVAYRFNRDGNLVYRMKARRSLHFPDDSISMQQPDMHYFAGGPGQWHITAKHGHIPPDNKRILLTKKVRANHTQPDKGPTHVKTSRAWVYPDRNLVTSKAHVIADEPAQRVVGDGMRLNTKTNQLKVLTNAHVTFKK